MVLSLSLVILACILEIYLWSQHYILWDLFYVLLVEGSHHSVMPDFFSSSGVCHKVRHNCRIDV